VAARSAAAKRAEAETGGGASARRRLAPAERTPQILGAALEEFAERGYAGASMAATAARAGVAKGLIYHYFPGKADLFKAVVRSCIQPVFSEAERLIAAFQGSRAELLRGLLELAYSRVAAERRERILFKLILAEADRFPELAAFYHAEVFSRALALVGGVLRAGAASGEFRPDAADAAGLAPVLVAPAIMASIWQMMLGEERAPDLAAMREAHVDLVLRGVLRTPALAAVQAGG
jgi:TetR/AcrR family transcriptional regulator